MVICNSERVYVNATYLMLNAENWSRWFGIQHSAFSIDSEAALFSSL